MNKELIMALDALEKENGIDKEIMFAAIEKSLMDEYKAEFDKADNGRVELDRRTGDFHIYSDRTVVEEVIVPENRENKKEKYVSGTDIALEDARKIKPDCQLGDVITVEVKSEEFSRKAAKNAKNTIVQTIREQEKNALYNEYHSKEKELITGICIELLTMVILQLILEDSRQFLRLMTSSRIRSLHQATELSYMLLM